MSAPVRPIPLDLTRHAALVEGAREFLRLWMGADGAVTSFVNPVPLGPDPAALGGALVEAARIGAKAYAKAVGIAEADALARIWEGLDAERAQPADRPAEPAAVPIRWELP